MIALFNIPTDHFPSLSRARTWSEPYIFATSQWQKWDIFSPEPSRRGPSYRLELVEGSGATVLKYIDFWHLDWRERAKEIKIVQRLEYGFEGYKETYMRAWCDRYSLQPDADIRLVGDVIIVPYDLPSLKHVRTIESLGTTPVTIATYRCPKNA